MLSQRSLDWIRKYQPELKVNEDKSAMEGFIYFRAAYNSNTNQFCLLEDLTKCDSDWLGLEGKFKIKILFSERIPTVFFPELTSNPARHINPDNTACLSAPGVLKLREQNTPDLIQWMETLILPFVYGQEYYEKFKKWPWEEFGHGVVGLIESYLKLEKSSLEELIDIIEKDSTSKHFKILLSKNRYIKGHMRCFCDKGDSIRRCHPNALKAFNKMIEDRNSPC